MTINDKIEKLIDEVLIELNEPVLDDMYPDMLADWDRKLEAIEYIEEKLLNMKAE